MSSFKIWTSCQFIILKIFLLNALFKVHTGLTGEKKECPFQSENSTSLRTAPPTSSPLFNSTGILHFGEMWPRNAQRLALNSVLICLGSTILLLAPCDASTEGAALTQGLVFPDGYNRNVPPAGKTLIRVAFEIEDISEISDNDISVTFKLVTTMNWNDSRLGVDERVFQQLEVEDR